VRECGPGDQSAGFEGGYRAVVFDGITVEPWERTHAFCYGEGEVEEGAAGGTAEKFAQAGEGEKEHLAGLCFSDFCGGCIIGF